VLKAGIGLEHRHPEIDVDRVGKPRRPEEALVGKCEISGHDAGDGKRLSVEHEPAADDARVAAETPAPESVAQDDLIDVPWPKRTAEGGFAAEDGEKAGPHDRRPDVLRPRV